MKVLGSAAHWIRGIGWTDCVDPVSVTYIAEVNMAPQISASLDVT